ncbi:hypothetical protein EDB86DRAFT_3079246 [Lactarius hatsudake]|nr:hypothetical protein EDB86DRAFT_3079246 [Lactarius hatsudake]
MEWASVFSVPVKAIFGGTGVLLLASTVLKPSADDFASFQAVPSAPGSATTTATSPMPGGAAETKPH